MNTSKYCEQCPRRCGADRANGEKGYCGAGREVRVAKVMLHEWEEPCFGGRAGAVFFVGCPLRCEYCQNRDISRPEESGLFGEIWTQEQMERAFLDLQERGATCLDLVSPTQYTSEIVAVLRKIKPQLKIPVVWNTGGYELPETIRTLAGLVDCFLTDFKYGTKETAERYSQAPDYPEVALAALKEMVKIMRATPSPIGETAIQTATAEQTGGVPWREPQPSCGRCPPPVEKVAESTDFSTVPPCIVLRHLVLPNGRRDSMQVLKTVAEEVGAENVTLSLMRQYTPGFAPADFPELARRITTFEYESVQDYALALGYAGFGQDKASATRKYTPDFAGNTRHTTQEI